MPTIELSRKDLEQLVGKKFSLAKAAEWIKASIEGKEDKLKVELRDINRPDLWCVEGIARELKRKLGIKFSYTAEPPTKTVRVDSKVKRVRPLISCAIVKNVQLNEAALAQLIQTQEKLCEGFGLKRREAALGLYDLDKITFPVTYTTARPDQIKFVPLGMEEELTLREILERHEKGRLYGHLIERAREWPLLIDASKQVLSMPPIINSAALGKITTQTKNIFIEATGFSARFVDFILLLMALALVDRGGKLEQVQIVTGLKRRITPQLSFKEFKVELAAINELLGLELKAEQLLKLLEASFELKKKTKSEAIALIPPWRQDVMALSDIAEDVAISYGYSAFKPLTPSLAAQGKLQRRALQAQLAELLVGIGAQEVVSFILTCPKLQFKKMRAKPQPLVELANPVVETKSCLRTWLLPSLLEFLSLNKSARYPQQLFELGKVVKAEEEAREEEHLCYVTAHSTATFSSAKQVLDYLFELLSLSYQLEPTEHSSFIEGRVAQIKVKNELIGIIGEVHPAVLEAFSLVMPVAAFELNLNKLQQLSS